MPRRPSPPDRSRANSTTCRNPPIAKAAGTSRRGPLRESSRIAIISRLGPVRLPGIGEYDNPRGIRCVLYPGSFDHFESRRAGAAVRAAGYAERFLLFE